MIKEIQLRVLPHEADSLHTLKQLAACQTDEQLSSIRAVRIVKRSIDARQRTVYVNVKLALFINEDPPALHYIPVDYREVSLSSPQVVVVGAGPAGLFAALRLIEAGIKPVVVERGKSVSERKRDIALISREHRVDPESNYSFGEGGAGAFSDGKLYTRSKKRGSVDRILHLLCQHGADPSILIDAHPHIGTDKLPGVISAIRETILRCGGEVRFQTRMDELIVVNEEVKGIRTHTGEEIPGFVILATGHSARDVYRYLHSASVALEVKGIAVGVRLEHPQQLIDQIQYHSPEGRGEHLPAAEYSYVTQCGDRGVYSFCMCPGGFVVPAASAEKQVVVNGMSPSNRGSNWANAGMVVEVRPEDLPEPYRGDLLGSMRFQEEMEYNAFLNGGMRQTAPAQRMVDFVNKKNSFSLPDSSYVPGLIASPLHFWMPDSVTKRLREAFTRFGGSARGFLTNEAVLIGVETRTSSPLRVPRDAETLQHVQLRGLYPCGEGAGYAGGIVSAAIDGDRCAEKIAEIAGRS